MTTCNLQLALVLIATVAVCLANTVTEADVQLDAPGTDVLFPVRERRQVADTVKCGHRLYMQAKNCCYLPQLLPQSAMQNCSGGRGPPPMNGTTGAATMKQLVNLTRELAKDMRMKGGPSCFFECLFKYQNWLNSNGDLNYDAIQSQFSSASNSTWQSLVTTAVSNCTAQVKASSGTSPTSSSGGKSCNSKPLQFMTCITQILVLNCPASLKAQGRTCSRDLATLATCNPMNVPVLASRNMRQPTLNA